MSVNVEELEIRIDGKKRYGVLSRYKDDDGVSFKSNFDNGYYPIDRSNGPFKYGDENIIKMIMKDFPNSEIFYRIRTDYGEAAYRAKGGKVIRLKKRWE